MIYYYALSIYDDCILTNITNKNGTKTKYIQGDCEKCCQQGLLYVNSIITDQATTIIPGIPEMSINYSHCSMVLESFGIIPKNKIMVKFVKS